MKTVWQKILHLTRTLAKALNWVEMNFLIFFTSFIGLFIMVEIVLRIFNVQGSRWIEELSRMMLVTTTLVGSSVAVKSKGHMAMSALINALPSKFANGLEILSNLICGAAFLYISYYSVIWTVNLYTVKRMMDSVSVPIWPFWAIISFAFITTGVRFLLQIKNNVADIKKGVHSEAGLKEM